VPVSTEGEAWTDSLFVTETSGCGPHLPALCFETEAEITIAVSLTLCLVLWCCLEHIQSSHPALCCYPPVFL